MTEIDEVKQRIEKRKKPLTDHHFKKLYNGMIRVMVLMAVIIGSLIVTKQPELETQVFNNQLVKQFITFVSQSVNSFLPEDQEVSTTVSFQKVKGNYYQSDSNVIKAFNQGKVIMVKKNDQLLGNYLVILDEKDVEITYANLKDIQVKKYQTVKPKQKLATYQKKFKMTFEYLGKKISYQKYQGM